jgi:hypothetical protein
MGGKWIGHSALIWAIGLTAAMPAGASTYPRDTPVAEFCAAVESELQKHQFAVLDTLAHELRDPEIRFIGGNSQLYEFYGVLGAFAGSPAFSCSSRASLEDKQKLLEQWAAAEPKSLAAHIALGQLWWAAGWKERGNDYADSVGFFQWISLYSDLSKAKSILAQVDTRADPHGYFLSMEIAQSEAGWFTNPRTTLEALYSKAIKAFPTYYHFYSQRAENLQERWYGQPGELPAYLASLPNSLGGDVGLVAYSFAAYKLMQGTERSILLRTTGLSWPLVQSGYAARERLYGLRNRDWNALCNLALAGIDRDAGKQALAHIGGNWDPAVWKERTYFDDAVGWINRAPK